MVRFDYIVAGAGSAGCALASRLAQSGVRVLLLEAGGPANSLFVRMPAGNGFLFGNPHYDWGLTSRPQPDLNGRSIYYPRGKGVGGSSNLNGMIYIRGNRRDFDTWKQMGLKGWGYTDLLPYFRKAEGSRHRNGAFHGRDGPLTVNPAPNHNALDKAFVESAVQAGAKRVEDFNGAHQTGAGRLDVTVDRGVRQSSARAYLRDQPDTLTVRTGCFVIGPALEKGRAVGMRIFHKNREEVLQAEQGVVLCLGAFGTPKALMLSGVGPADHLKAVGVNPTLDLPGVGKNLSDHLNMPIQYACTRPELTFAPLQRLDRAVGLGLNYLLRKRGPGAGPFWSVCAFHGPDEEDYPEYQTYLTRMVVKENLSDGEQEEASFLERFGRRIFVRGSKVALPGFQTDTNLLRPKSVGRVTISSDDPSAPPDIDPRFLSDPDDLARMVRAVHLMRDVIAQDALTPYRGVELSPGPACRTDREIEQAVRTLVTTGHHPVGTCKMGLAEDSMAVLDEEMKVRGIDGLRVVDASVFPTQITGNPNALIIALAEKAADLILGRPVFPAFEGTGK